ncbi:SigE family RNA polymerase sigma factor [Blastococcus xanthinilyticus]|uniref:RNA polymerase sigma-70 factor (Sigma-E family) n=1 Tax=Blastococcus xanthinilyticus TaxID=1564164 RepID=A0A5S5CSD2_9ACTN|nr:SigE family RNA polymerase sigma factor [Blastococcus xanthinilyticus]TYP83823.1 RNA polymerase sigma-70 factor (sigma-E family) [Blastococcus xanthinilyticus]
MDRDEEFARFVDERWPVLVRSAVLLGCAPAEAEDLVQTALVRCYVAWSKVRGATNRDGYVYRVLVNCHHDSHRRRWRRERPTDELPEVPSDDLTGQVDDADAVRRALARLSQAHREVVVLRYYAHLGEQQIADALRIAPGTVKSRLSRALAQLQTDLDVAELREGRAS